MSKTSVEETLKLIPSLFEINLNTDKSGTLIFQKLAQILDFDEGFIYFLNPESLQLKYSFKEHKNYKANSIFEMSAELKKEMFTKEGKLLQPDSEFIKTVGLAELKKKSYVLAKISIKSTVLVYCACTSSSEASPSEKNSNKICNSSALFLALSKPSTHFFFDLMARTITSASLALFQKSGANVFSSSF